MINTYLSLVAEDVEAADGRCVLMGFVFTETEGGGVGSTQRHYLLCPDESLTRACDCVKGRCHHMC